MIYLNWYLGISCAIALVVFLVFACEDVLCLLKLKQPDHKFGYNLSVQAWGGRIRDVGVGWYFVILSLPVINIIPILFFLSMAVSAYLPPTAKYYATERFTSKKKRQAREDALKEAELLKAMIKSGFSSLANTPEEQAQVDRLFRNSSVHFGHGYSVHMVGDEDLWVMDKDNKPVLQRKVTGLEPFLIRHLVANEVIIRSVANKTAGETNRRH